MFPNHPPKHESRSRFRAKTSRLIDHKGQKTLITSNITHDYYKALIVYTDKTFSWEYWKEIRKDE